MPSRDGGIPASLDRGEPVLAGTAPFPGAPRTSFRAHPSHDHGAGNSPDEVMATLRRSRTTGHTRKTRRGGRNETRKRVTSTQNRKPGVLVSADHRNDARSWGGAHVTSQHKQRS